MSEEKLCVRCGRVCEPIEIIGEKPNRVVVGGWYSTRDGEGPLCFSCSCWAAIEFGVTHKE